MRRAVAVSAVATAGSGAGPASATVSCARGALVLGAAMTTVRGPPGAGIVTVSARPVASRLAGGNAATPCDDRVRRRSTGSPAGPRSSSSANGLIPRR